MRKLILVLRAAALALLFSLALASWAQGIYQVTSEAAARAAYEFEQSLKDNGLNMSKSDMKAVEFLFRQKEAITTLRKNLIEAERRASASGLKDEVKKLQAEKKALDTIWKHLPQVPTIAQIRGNEPGLEQQLREYVAQRAKGDERRIGRTDQVVQKVVQKIEKTKQEGNAPATRSPNDKGAWVAIVTQTPPLPDKHGSVEILINGQTVTRTSQEVRVRLGQPLLIRVIGIDARRSMIRGFTETAITDLVGTKTDYGITYKAKSGNFSGTSTFTMKSEEYEWAISLSGDRDADYKISDSRIKPGLKDDLATVTFKNQVTLKITVSMKIAWSADSARPGGRKTGTEEGTARTTFTVKVVPD